jgi:hypothetical protein
LHCYAQNGRSHPPVTSRESPSFHLAGYAAGVIKTRALALYFVFYNFVRRHQTLRVSPAWRQVLWSMDDIVALVDTAEGEPKKRGSYKPRQPKTAAAISNESLPRGKRLA